MSEEQKSVEISNPTLGSIKIFGMDPTILFTVFSLITTTAMLMFLYSHDSNAGKELAGVAQSLKESNKEVANVLKEQSKETTQILREIARATRESNCLAEFETARLKAQNRDLCRRLSQ